MADLGTIPNPLVYRGDDFLGRSILLTISWNAATAKLTEVTTVRDPGCLFTHVLVGRGGDGRPDSTPKRFAVPEGTTSVPLNSLRALSMTTIHEVVDEGQITVGV